MAKKTMASFLLVSVFLVLVMAPNSVRAITCQEGVMTLFPCLPYLLGASTEPVAPCCQGVASLNEQAADIGIRKTLCDCFKKAASSYGVDASKATSLPGACKIVPVVPIDPNIDCNNIKYDSGKF